ncbi:MAG: hypothetical protein LAN64_02640 [Acidobacteriia bacterium]|nr:hypothetical protein [Terriglobia bacterium]
MQKSAPERGPEPDRIYRDLDGTLVLVVEVSRNLCTWVPVTVGEESRHVTHRDNFLRRFTPLKKAIEKMAA